MKKAYILTPKEFEEKMKDIQQKYYTSFHEIGERHIAMDSLMCNQLRALGFEKGVRIFEESDKQYE